ncbi:hypothetical protein F5878DRAFT_646939 [Lentinula raphanica]|uniref:Uncharacterized protein n=1 Tax=Lentinula raphanica TaxID=153919 RepID=A0AA38U4K1_9AGAR|nr:hypothetical protein F5878DRAFT_646939 [Lentinula raphanica]
MDPGLSLLQALVEEKNALTGSTATFSGLSRHIRTLYNDSLSTTYYPESDSDFEKKQREFRHTYQVKEQERSWLKVESPSLEGERKLHLFFKPALESLDGLTAFQYSFTLLARLMKFHNL